MKKVKRNFLLESTLGIFKSLPKGRVLDLGCGDGDYSHGLKNMGFEVIPGDIDAKRFKYGNEFEFKHCDISKDLPFPDKHFDYVILMEVIEHLRTPSRVIAQISRVLKDDGSVILSTPNILNLNSRFRFFFEGCYEYFREPPLDQSRNPKEVIFNLHIAPYRYQELEYLLYEGGFSICDIKSSNFEGRWLSIMLPIILFQCWQKERRALKKGGIEYKRINKILLSKDLLFGRHLIIRAQKFIKT